MKKDLFTVFLGTFNAEPWISEVIASLEAQDCEKFPVVIVDNDSTDKTVPIIKNIFQNYSLKNEYKLFKNKKNIGAISSFLDQLELFDSEWIVMIHQDDHYHTDHISTLKFAMSNCTEETSVIFSAMNRINSEGVEKISPPTLSSKISESDRFENFLLSLQILPVNFPACALRKNAIKDLTTSRHTTAFNDAELLLRMMCTSDIKYIPKETMHYRVYSGNASSITGSFANDKAVFIGLNELFHSEEVNELLSKHDSQNSIQKLITSIDNAIEIRISDQVLQKILRVTIAERLNRLYGFRKKIVAEYLSESLKQLELDRESAVVTNLANHQLADNLAQSKFDSSLPELNLNNLNDAITSKSYLLKVINNIDLKSREKFFNFVFSNPLLKIINRPFAKVWRLRNRKI